MDGTLMDSIKIWLEAEQRIVDDAGIVLSKADRDELNALTLEEAGDFFHERFGIMASSQEVIDAIIGHMLHFYNTQAEANPGAIDFVRAVYESGNPLCVLSSSPQTFIRAGLAKSGLGDFFEDGLIVSAEDLGATKREKHVFSTVCDRMGVAFERTWLFDDSWYALATARECGIKCVGVFSSDHCGTHEELGRYAELVVDDFTQLSAGDFL